MRILVTGHAGYLGSVLVPLLGTAGFEVRGLDSLLYEECTLGPREALLDPEPLDVRDAEISSLAGVDAVVHLAGLSNDPLGDYDPAYTHEINHRASIRLAKLARRAGVRRFVFASSCSVYGGAGGGELADESSPLDPLTPYAASKARVEQGLHALATDDFSPVSLRCATLHGFSPRLRTDLVVNDLVGRAHLTGRVTVLSRGCSWRPLVHVEDAARAFRAALEAAPEVIHDQAFNVGTQEENYRVRDIAEIVCAAVPGSRLEIAGRRGADARSYRVDFRKIAQRLPGFRPRWDLASGARDLHQRYLEHELRQEDFDVRFRRLPWLLGLRSRGLVSEDLRPFAGLRRASGLVA